MTELAIREDTSALVAVDSNVAAQALVEWARAAQAAHDIAVPLAGTDFVPAHFRNQPAAATAAVLAGAEVGLSPLQSLQSIYVVSGKPAMYAQTLRALCQARGHDIWVEDQSETRVVVCGRRRGSQQVEKAVWSMDRARKAGYTRNQKYQSDPIGMLTARATADIARRIAADALAGLAYSVEELYDEPVVTLVQQSQPARRTAKRAEPVPKPAAAPKPEPVPVDDAEPDFEDAAPAAESEPVTKGGITSAQIKKIAILMRELGMIDHDLALEFVADTIGHQVGSRNELTRDEASQVIEALLKDQAAGVSA